MCCFTIVLGSQVDHNFIRVVSQILLVLQFKIFQKKLHQKHFTIAKPLIYLELQVKNVRLPAKLCQTRESSRKCNFLVFLAKFSLISWFRSKCSAKLEDCQQKSKLRSERWRETWRANQNAQNFFWQTFWQAIASDWLCQRPMRTLSSIVVKNRLSFDFLLTNSPIDEMATGNSKYWKTVHFMRPTSSFRDRNRD